jgi:hypothetical protein
MSHPKAMTDEYRFYLLRKRFAEGLILSAFRKLRRAGIEPILIKGWAAAQNYPETVPRFFSDIDLAVEASEYERARNLIEKENIGGIDLHRELRQLDTLPWARLFRNSELVGMEDEEIRVLCPEDHLRVLCVHWLISGGENRERLWDIVYAVRNRPEEFDWSKCLGVVNPTRRQWIIMTVGIAHRYMNLELEGIPFAEEAKDLPVWVVRRLEKEWAKNLEIRSLRSQLNHPIGLIRQIKKRIPPNPIQATVDCEGEFTMTRRRRFEYQIRHMIRRLIAVVRRVPHILSSKWA